MWQLNPCKLTTSKLRESFKKRTYIFIYIYIKLLLSKSTNNKLRINVLDLNQEITDLKN